MGTRVTATGRHVPFKLCIVGLLAITRRCTLFSLLYYTASRLFTHESRFFVSIPSGSI